MPSGLPNIVYIHSHDTGRYVQPYGFPVDTPRIQGLAEDGVLFRQAFSAAPTCSPSRAALLTGETPHQAGMLGLAHRGFRLNHPERHLATFLRQHGYETVLTGMQHLEEGDQATVGYTRDLRPDRLNVVDVAPIAVDLIREHDASEGPLFLDVGFEEAHRPFLDPQDDSRWVRPPAPLHDSPETREDMAGYLESAKEYDRGVGMVLDALHERGIRENTIVVCTTDHGVPFPGMKGSLTDHGLGVVLVISAPQHGFGDGKVVDALVSQMDVFPTLCDLLSLEAPAWLQGASLAPLVQGDVDTIHEELFGEVTFHATYEPMRSVRTPRWLYVRRFGGKQRPVLANIDEGLSRDSLLAYNLEDQEVAEEALYDVVFDPVQRHNLAGKEVHADTLAQLRSRLAEWMRATGDPLLDGDVPLPEGARMNRRDARSADEPLVDRMDDSD
jgi:N-sulfoglucosamine sulfohydrolase